MALIGQIAVDLQAGTADFIKGMQSSAVSVEALTSTISEQAQAFVESVATIENLQAALTALETVTTALEGGALLAIPALAFGAGAAVAYIVSEIEALRNSDGIAIQADELKRLEENASSASVAMDDMIERTRDAAASFGLSKAQNDLRRFNEAASDQIASINAMVGKTKERSWGDILLGDPAEVALTAAEAQRQIAEINRKRDELTKNVRDLEGKQTIASEAAARKKAADELGRQQTNDMIKAERQQERAYQDRVRRQEQERKESARRIWDFERQMEKEFFRKGPKAPREERERPYVNPALQFGTAEAYSAVINATNPKIDKTNTILEKIERNTGKKPEIAKL